MHIAQIKFFFSMKYDALNSVFVFKVSEYIHEEICTALNNYMYKSVLYSTIPVKHDSFKLKSDRRDWSRFYTVRK